MAKIKPYKLVNPGGGGGKSTLAANGPRTNLLAVNRLGNTIGSLGSLVKDIHTISLASVKTDKMREIAERRRMQRERDQKNEDDLERRNALMGKGINLKTKIQKKPKKSILEQIMQSLFGGLEGMLFSVFKWIATIVAWDVTKYILGWIGNPNNKKKIEVFVEKLHFVFSKLYGFAKGSVTKVLDGFSALTDGNNSFWGRLKGLGTLLLGIVGLQALLNPFGLMDAILSMLNLDFYNPNRNTRSKGDGKTSRTGKSGPTPKHQKITRTSQNVAKRYGKNGSRVYRDALRQGLSESEALKRVKRLANRKPSAFKPPPKTSGLSPKGPNVKPGQVFSKGIQRGVGRGALKFLGPANLKLLKGAFKQTFGRIPIFGALLTGIFSILSGDPWDKAIFKTLGSAVGGALGTLIPVPGIGSLIGMMGGEYVGELLYIGFRGGGWKAAGKKFREDLMGLFHSVTKMLSWISTGWKRFYAGIPKFKIPDFPKEPPKWIPPLGFGMRNKIWGGAKIAMKAMLGPFGLMMGKEIPNVFWMANLTGNTFPLFHSAFFKQQAGSAPVETGQAMEGVKSDKTAGDGDPTSATEGDGTSGTTKGKPIRNHRGRIIGYEGDEKPVTAGSVYNESVQSPFEKSERQKNRHGSPNVRTDKGDEYQNQWWDFLDVFKNPKKKEKPKSVWDIDSSIFGDDYQMPDLGKGWDSGSVFDTKPKDDGIWNNPDIWKKDESIFGKDYKIPDTGSFDIDFGGGTTKKEEPAKKKSSWWNPFSWATGGKLLRRLPRLNTKQFFFGKIFKGISKAVSGVVKGVSKVVSGIGSAVGGIMNSPIGQILGTVVPIVFPPAAPFIAGIKAISAAASGDIFGAITGGIGALGGMFPGTFGGIADSVSGFMQNNPLGKALGGFMQGGIGGALGSLTSFLPEGVQGLMNKFGGFVKKFPAVGGLIGMIPGIANVPGLSQLFGLDSFGVGGFSPMGLLGNIADNMGMGGLFRTITGMMGTGGPGALMGGLREMAAELGVDPRVLGVIPSSQKHFSNKEGGLSREYAMQSSLEFVPVPMLLERLMEIQTPVPIPRPVPVPMPQPAQA